MPKLVRISRDNKSVIVTDGESYTQLSADSAVLAVNKDLPTLLSEGSWRRPVSADLERYSSLLTVSVSENKERQLRLPKKMQEALVVLAANPILTAEERNRVEAITVSSKATASDAHWLLELKDRAIRSAKELSNETMTQWAEKVSNANPEELSSFEPSEDLHYYVAGDNEHSTDVDTLLAVTTDGTLLEWTEDEFKEIPNTIEDYDRPYITQVSTEDARTVAEWITAGKKDGSIDITSTNPTEANLFALAESEIDWDFVDTLGAIVADATGYSREERRRNAMRQRRNNGGKFAPMNRGRIEPKQQPKKAESGINKATAGKTPLGKLSKDKYTSFEQSRAWHYWHRARLQKLLPLILESGKDISTWIKENHALWNLRSYKPEPLAAAGGVEETVNTENKEGAIEKDGVSGLYFAIVDETDHSAVLDIVAIRDDGNGNPTTWVRRGGQWVQDDRLLADLKGATPPPVVRVEDEEEVKSVLAQVDAYDKKNGNKSPDEAIGVDEDDAEALAATAYSKEQRENDSKKGYARPDGSYPIRDVSDLKNAIQAYGRAKEGDRAAVRRHIRKRAKALNRTDLIPDSWKEMQLQDFWEGVHDQSVLYGEFGEVLVAAGVPGVADAPSDFEAVRRLENYWTREVGAAKVGWGSDGDLTRCHAHLAKYVGPEKAWGLCQNYHKKVFKTTNYKRDNG